MQIIMLKTNIIDKEYSGHRFYFALLKTIRVNLLQGIKNILTLWLYLSERLWNLSETKRFNPKKIQSSWDI